MVYDVVQQVFNGSLERGYNRILAQNLFSNSTCDTLSSNLEVTQRILEGQTASDKSQKEKGMRLGYMGHLTLIAEEVCKFVERHPVELLGDVVMDRVTSSEWVAYIEGTLTETREKDNAVLGGVRPEQSIGIRSMGGNAGGATGFGEGGNTSGLADTGLAVPEDSLAMHDAGAGGYEANVGSGLLSGFGEGEDEEMEEVEEIEERKAVEDDEQVGELSFDDVDMNFR